MIKIIVSLLCYAIFVSQAAFAAPSPPNLSSPADYSIYNRNNTSSVTFSWSSVSGALEYWLNVFPSGDSPNPKYNASVSGTSQPVTVSSWASNIYIWQVKVRTSAGWSSYSTARQLIVDYPPGTPTLNTPANSASFPIAGSSDFTWTAPSGGTVARYTFRIVSGTDINLNQKVHKELSGTTDNESFSDSLYDPGTHTWAVRAIKQVPPGYSQSTYETTVNWGQYATRTFTIASPPSPPNLSSPADYSIYNRNNTSSVTFSWSSVSGALEYWLNVFPSGDSPNPKYNASVSGTSQPVTVSSWESNIYIWQVRVRTSAGWSSYSTARQFIVDYPPGPPILNSPATGASFPIAGSSDFTWTAPSGGTVERYTFRIVSGTDINLNQKVHKELSGTTNNESFSDSLYDQGTHTWAVRAIKKVPPGYSQSTYETTVNWGQYATRTFTIASPPSPPALSSPADYSIYNRNNTSSVTFSWSSVSGALEYWLNVFPSGDSPNPKYNGSVSGTSQPVTVSSWVSNIYIWQVKVRTSAGWSSYSTARQFIVDYPPGPPTLNSPATGALFPIAGSSDFTWTAPSGGTVERYTFRIVSGTDLNQDSNLKVHAEPSGTTYNESLSDSRYDPGIHTWAVRAIKKVPPGYSQSTYETTVNWGQYATRTFTVVSSPSGPNLSSPADYSIYNRNNTSSVTFSWSSVSGALEYWLNVFPSGDSPNPKYNGSVSGTSQPVIVSSWESNIYIWQVRVRTSAGWSSYSTARQFIVDYPPGPPTLNSPATGASFPIAGSGNFTWTAPSGGTVERYTFRIVSGTDLNQDQNLKSHKELPGTTYNESFSDSLYDPGTHTWAVRAIKKAPPGYIQLTYETTVKWGEYATRAFTVTLPPTVNPVFVPLFRGYSKTATDHFYTTNPVERDTNMPAAGYVFEKVEAYISNRPFIGGVSLYRLYHSGGKSHYYTTSSAERDSAIAQGFTYEGEAGYVYPNPTEYMVPMYHLYSSSANDHFFTISEFERNNATTKCSYEDKGIAFYVSRNGSGAPLAGKPVAKKGGVDLSSGNFAPYNNHVDFACPPGFGQPFVFARSYNSANTGDSGPLGPGWSHNYQIYVVDSGGSVLVKWGNGRDDSYELDGSTYKPGPGVFNKLVKTEGSYILTTKDKTVYTFVESVENGVSIGRVVEIKDRNGVKQTLIHDPAMQNVLSNVVDGSNRKYRFHYDKFGSLSTSNEYRLILIKEEVPGVSERSISFGYDQLGRLSSFTDAKNNTTNYAYEFSGNPGILTRITLPEQNTITAQYYDDPNQKNYERLKTIQIGTSKTVQVSYDEIIDSTSVGTTYTVFSSTGSVVEKIQASHDQYRLGMLKDAMDNKSQFSGYDPNNNPTQFTDNKGTSLFDYDLTTGNIKSAKNPLSQTALYEYDPNELNNLAKITDPANNVTRFEYDTKGNLKYIIHVVDGVDRTTTIDRFANGQVEIITAPPNNAANIQSKTTYSYDTYGYLKTVSDLLGNTASFIYDPLGRLRTKIDADQVWMQYQYDQLNHVTTATDMLNRVTSYNYDRNGNLDTMTDPRKIVTDYNYTDRDLVETVTQAGNRIAKYGYDEADRQTKVINSKDRSWQMTFDEAGNLKSKITPLGLTDNFVEHYPDGALKRQVDRNSRETAYTYDNAGRLDTMNITSGRQYTFRYYDNGLAKTVFKNGSQAGSFQYDARGNLTAYTDPHNQTVSYTYYPGGNLKTITYPGSKVVTYDYDTSNRLITVQDWKGRITRYEYTPGSRLKKLIYPNGATIEYIYDAYYFRRQTVRNKKADGTVIAQYTVDNFDDLDAPLKMTTIGGIPAPVTALSEDYGYDLNNRITGAGIAVFTHNPMGEILTRTRGGSTDTFGWDSTDVSGRLQTMTVNGTSRTYEYDGLGNRLSSTIGGVTTRYVLDVSGSLSNVLAETDAGGTVTAYYIYGIGLVGKLLPDMAGTARYYHYDRGGNTVALTDDAGNVTDQYAYDSDPYGFNFARQGSTQNSFTFVGRYGVMDEGNNIIYMRARFYDAAIGQFLSEDPINFKGGDLNLYAYVGGNPLRGIDPTGLKKDISLSEMFFDFADTIIDIGTEVLKDASDKIVPLMKGGVLEKSKNLKIPDFAGKALDALTIVLNVGYEWKASNVSWDSLWSGDLSLLTTDDWLDAIAHGTASVTSVSWNSAAQLSGLDIIVKYSSGGERSILLTSDQVIKFTKNVTSPNQSQNSGGSW